MVKVHPYKIMLSSFKNFYVDKMQENSHSLHSFFPGFSRFCYQYAWGIVQHSNIYQSIFIFMKLHDLYFAIPMYPFIQIIFTILKNFASKQEMDFLVTKIQGNQIN